MKLPLTAKQKLFWIYLLTHLKISSMKINWESLKTKQKNQWNIHSWGLNNCTRLWMKLCSLKGRDLLSYKAQNNLLITILSLSLKVLCATLYKCAHNRQQWAKWQGRLKKILSVNKLQVNNEITICLYTIPTNSTNFKIT